MGYIDEFCVKADTKPACINSLSTSKKLFDSLGFTVHPENSKLVLVIVLFLGFNLDSIKMEVGCNYH